MNLPFNLGFPLVGTRRERLCSAHKARALSEVETRQRGIQVFSLAEISLKDGKTQNR